MRSFTRPVAARARWTACRLASVPDVQKATFSADGMSPQICSASSTSPACGPTQFRSQVAAARETASFTRGSQWPTTIGP